mgnify:CR=1 FL=1
MSDVARRSARRRPTNSRATSGLAPGQVSDVVLRDVGRYAVEDPHSVIDQGLHVDERRSRAREMDELIVLAAFSGVGDGSAIAEGSAEVPVLRRGSTLRSATGRDHVIELRHRRPLRPEVRFDGE